MKVSFKYHDAKALHAQKLITVDWTYERMLVSTDPEKIKEYETDLITVDLTSYTKKQASDLLKAVEVLAIPGKPVGIIKRWLDVLANPAAGLISSLPTMEKILLEYYKTCKVKWLWRENADGKMVPYAIMNIKYQNRNRDDSAHLSIMLERGLYLGEKKSSYGLGSKDSIQFYNGDITGEEEQVSFFGNDDDEDDKPKKPKKETAKALHEILRERNLFLHTDDLLAEYEEQIFAARKMQKLLGSQFTSDAAIGLTIKSDDWGSTSKWLPLSDEDGQHKLVVDSSNEVEARSATTTSDLYKDVATAFHPYVKCYNITKHYPIFVHIDSLQEYQYNDKIIDSLVLDEQVKFILNSIMSGSQDISEDVVKGKGGGLIILGSGPAGVGKTLTAEVYSEYVGKPLYQIQSAQLGIKIEDIEKNLFDVLKRADRWNAVLLIDEADAYVYRRGTDILQNCIVGTFLRLLEYFNGVMFLTTNRADIIDDAIMSRVTAHIKYELPTPAQSKLIWKSLCKNYSLELTDASIDSICARHKFSGRDIRNTIKLLKKIYGNKPIGLTQFDGILAYRPQLNKN